MDADLAKLVSNIEGRRQTVSSGLSSKHRARFGQFFTPSTVAAFLADRLVLPQAGRFRLLDPGAGVGSLSAAVVRRVLAERPNLKLEITAFEVDEALVPHLAESLDECVALGSARGVSVEVDVRGSSFVEYATGWLLEEPHEFDAVIANPPYRKVNTKASERVAAEAVGLRASNLYTIFTGLAVGLLADGGQMSVIIPRSWANGPYHEPFRRFVLESMSLNFIHLYGSRATIFADTEVLQENMVVHGFRGPQTDTITLSTSAGDDDPRVERSVSVDEVIHPGDRHAFVHVPLDETATAIAGQMLRLPATLSDLSLEVSTGRVVDFRTRDDLVKEPEAGTVPLVYPGHLRDAHLVWPTPAGKKPNALRRSPETEPLLLPNETFVLVKRFSAKEELRRVVAAVSLPASLPGEAVAFENHLNVYHRGGRGLPLPLALGLTAFLNSSLVDEYVRSFSGHTQINATDLRRLRYPSLDALEAIGRLLADRDWPSEPELNLLVAEYLQEPATMGLTAEVLAP